jgi:lipoprotein-anchoring transpeptidase ErfK/SrfK
VGDSFRWIDVDLTHQRLIAYEGETPVRTVIVSTGLPRTPTPPGRFKIYVKYKAASMSGPGYYLPNVPYVMYFYRGYGLHGTYWHSNFGQPMSHGCVNLPTPQAEWLYNWASVGTPVVVHY